MQLERLPDEATLGLAARASTIDDQLREEPGRRRAARRVLAAIERHGDPGRLLDLGCSAGFLASEAEARGWEAYGIGPSEPSLVQARERSPLEVTTAGLLDANLPPHSFHAVVLADVIERLPHPGEVLEHANGLLARRGVLALTLPDAGSRVARLMGRRWWSIVPAHIHHFTRRSVEILLARHDFEVLEVATMPRTFSLRHFVRRLGGYSPSLATGLGRAAERAGIADLPLTAPLGDRMLVVAGRQGERASLELSATDGPREAARGGAD